MKKAGEEARVVVLVDGEDRETGRAEKVWAHRNGGVRHRAFSVLLWNAKGECLLQRRAAGKYHFPGLWTNACCSHPGPGEEVAAAAGRRLREELGLAGVELRERFVFEYRAESKATGLWEWEVDHVLEGRWDGAAESLRPNPEEVDGVRWATAEEIDGAMAGGGAGYTPWFRELWKRRASRGGRGRHPSGLRQSAACSANMGSQGKERHAVAFEGMARLKPTRQKTNGYGISKTTLWGGGKGGAEGSPGEEGAVAAGGEAADGVEGG